MASQNRRYNKSGANRSEGSSNASSPTSSINLSNTNHGNNNNAPKYGTVVPNRVFVGGISSTTTEDELCQLFRKYGNVKATKIIVDRAGVSKGYGFVTFDSEEEAKLFLRDAENIVLKERRLNIAPAVKKQPFNRSFETPTSPPPIAPPNIFYHNGIPYTFHNGMAFFTPTNTQAVPALPAPPADPNTVFQAYGPQPSAPATYGPTLMYSCANPAPPMFMPPPQYHPYPQMPFDCFPHMAANGGPYIYNGTGTPSTGRSSPVNTPDNVPANHLSALPAPPPPTYYPPSYQQPEMCYPTTIPQGMYPYYAVNPQEGYLQYCDVPQPVDPPSSNMSSEVPQQFMQTRQYYNPSQQYSVPPPLPPKRFQNPSKKSNGSNNMVGNGGMQNRGKYRGNVHSGSTDKPSLLGAGDAPSLLHLSLTPPGTPSLTNNTNSSATSKELTAQMKTLTI